MKNSCTMLKYQKHIIIYLFTCLTLIFCPDGHAAEPTTTLAFRIAYLQETPFLHETYKPTEHLEARFKILSKYFKNSYALIPESFQPRSAVELFNSGKINVYAAFAKSPQRMYQLKFSKNPFFITSLNIVTNGDKNITYGDLESLKDKSIAILSMNTEGKGQLDDFLKKNNVVMEYKIYEDNMEFASSEADFKLSTAYYMTNGHRIVTRVGEQGLYFATLPKHEHILTILDHALEQANRNDAHALRELNEKYVSKNIIGVHQNLTPEEMQRAKKTDEVHQLAYLDNHYPIQYVNSEGHPAGITISVLELFKQIHDNPSELTAYNLDTAIDLKKFDMLFSVVGNTSLKDEFFHTSDIYLNLPMVFFQRTKTKKINSFGMLDYSTLDHAEVQKNFPFWEMQLFKSLDKMFIAYRKNEIHTILLSEPEAEYAIAKLGIKHNKLVPATLNLPLRFYLSKKYPLAAVNILNSYINNLNPVALQKVVLESTLSIRPPVTVLGFILEHRIILISIAALGLLTLFAMHTLRLRQTKNKYLKLSQTDAITGLYTKEKAYAIIEQTLEKAHPDEYIIICVDIDKYSLLNQVYGSDKANEVLCFLGNFLKNKYAKRLKAECVARLSHDVFLTFGKIKHIGEALDSQEDDLTIIYEIKEILSSDYNISLSRGCFIIDDVTLPVNTIISYCLFANIASKKEHGLTTTFFNEEMKKTIDAQKDIIYKMEHGIENNEFILNFQPKVKASDGNICGAEVLVRWQAPNSPTIYPDNFISVFEKNAFISKLDIYIFEKTCKFIMENRANLYIPPIAINFSSITLLHVDTLQHVKDILQEYQVIPSEIEIEITESAMVNKAGAFIDTINELHKLGFSIAIDDFGTGVSSLHRLSSLNIHTVKLDKSFLDENFTTKKGVFLVASIINMLRKLGIQVVAEGVETKLQLTILQKLHCDIIQGYYFYKPMGMESFVEVLKSLKMNGLDMVTTPNSNDIGTST